MESSSTTELQFELKLLQEQLTCGICFEFFINCMMTKCSHNFCSFCIRKYLSHNTSCPVCFQETFEFDLVSNRQMDSVVNSFKGLRFKLQNVIKENVGEASDNTESKWELSGHSQMDCKLDHVGTSNYHAVNTNSKVCCTECKVEVPEKNILVHMETCKKRRDDYKKGLLNPVTVKRNYLTKKVYRFMKDKDLKDELRKYGLNTRGNREVLINRHKNFVILYNSDCDSMFPRNVPELVMQLENEELQLKREAEKVASNAVQGLKVNRNMCREDVERHQADYLASHHDHFQHLLQSARRNRTNRHKLCVNNSDKSRTVSSTSRFNCPNVFTEEPFFQSDVPDASGIVDTSMQICDHRLSASEVDDDDDDFIVSEKDKRCATMAGLARFRLDSLRSSK